MCWVGFHFLSSFDVTPIALADKLLVLLVFPRCEVVSIQLFTGKRVAHLSLHDGRNGFSSSLGYELCSSATIMINLFFLNVGVGTTHADGLDQTSDCSDTM